jgi:murein DD-endopeptidase MepM/ murein hydrolase activator NlpD
MKEWLNLIIVSKKHNFSWGIKLPWNLICVGLATSIIIIISTIVLVLHNAREVYAKMNLGTMEYKYEVSLRTLDSLKSLLDNSQNVFENQIAQDNRERTYWQIDYLHPDVWSMGIGGKNHTTANGYLSENTNKKLKELYQSVDILKGKYYLRQTSLKEIQSQIEKSQYLWGHIPSVNPVPNGHFCSGFGYRVDPINKRVKMHWGIDIGAKRGTPISASADGVVSFVGWVQGYGWTVDVDHGFGFKTRYAHCNSILVKKKDLVKRGQTIATVGSSGRSISPHLHYEVRVSGVKVNPKSYIDFSSVVFD